MNRSKELYLEWQENGGNLRNYDLPGEITDGRGYTRWFESRVRRTHSAKEGVIELLRERDPDESAHVLYKHRGSDTWMHIQSRASLVVGADMGFRAWLTINGQSLTVGVGKVSTDPEEVIEWARDWMESHPEGYDDA